MHYCLPFTLLEIRDHGLCGHASPVLAATGLVNGTWRFLTPYRIAPLNRLPKKLSQAIPSATPIAERAKFGAYPPLGVSGRMGEI